MRSATNRSAGGASRRPSARAAATDEFSEKNNARADPSLNPDSPRRRRLAVPGGRGKTH